MDEKALRRAALITLRRAICQRFPRGREREGWLEWAGRRRELTYGLVAAGLTRGSGSGRALAPFPLEHLPRCPHEARGSRGYRQNL
jgi:hypothetical protein